MTQADGGLMGRIRALPKMRRFAVFLTMAALVAAAGSLLTWFTVYRQPEARQVAVAIVAPMTGPIAIGISLRDGAALQVAATQCRPRRPSGQIGRLRRGGTRRARACRRRSRRGRRRQPRHPAAPTDEPPCRQPRQPP
jgi:hypothetical protein